MGNIALTYVFLCCNIWRMRNLLCLDHSLHTHTRLQRLIREEWEVLQAREKQVEEKRERTRREKEVNSSSALLAVSMALAFRCHIAIVL